MVRGAPGVERGPDARGAISGILYFLAPVFTVLTAIGALAIALFRRLLSRGGPEKRAELSTDTTSVLFVLRPDRIDVHNFRVLDRFASAHLLTLTPSEHPVRMLDVGEHGETTVTFGHSEWKVRARHVAAFREQIDALGYSIAPND